MSLHKSIHSTLPHQYTYKHSLFLPSCPAATYPLAPHFTSRHVTSLYVTSLPCASNIQCQTSPIIPSPLVICSLNGEFPLPSQPSSFTQFLLFLFFALVPFLSLISIPCPSLRQFLYSLFSLLYFIQLFPFLFSPMSYLTSIS